MRWEGSNVRPGSGGGQVRSGVGSLDQSRRVAPRALRINQLFVPHGPSRLLIGLQDEQAGATVELIGLEAQADLLVEGHAATRRVGFAALFTGGIHEHDDLVTVSALRSQFVRSSTTSGSRCGA